MLLTVALPTCLMRKLRGTNGVEIAIDTVGSDDIRFVVGVESEIDGIVAVVIAVAFDAFDDNNNDAIATGAVDAFGDALAVVITSKFSLR